MDYTFLWDSTLHHVRIPVDLEHESEAVKWRYVQHKIVSGSHVGAMVHAMIAAHPGLSFSTALPPSYEKPLLISSLLPGASSADTFSRAGSGSSHRNFHKSSSSASGREGTRAAAGTAGPGKHGPPRPRSTPSLARAPPSTGSLKSMQSRPAKMTATQGTGGWKGSRTTTPAGRPRVPPS